MSKSVQNDRQILPREVNGRGREAESPSCFDPLQAFSCGRSAGRNEISRIHFCQRIRWLFLGAAVGVALAAVYVQVFLSAPVLHAVR